MVPILGKSANPIGIAKYSWTKSKVNSNEYFPGVLLGSILAFSSATRTTGGTNIVNTRKMRETAVYRTAT